MKKTILAVLALASVVACNKSEVLEVAPQKAISFGNPFVENATKAIDPSETVATLEGFKVYGTLTTDAAITNIFNGVEVKKQSDGVGATYKYSSDYTQYWMPNVKYNFKAVANADNVVVDENGMPTTISYTADGTTDLLYAVSDEIDMNHANFEKEVAFNFNHLLSKVIFKFTNNYPSTIGAPIFITVSDVKIVNTASAATYTIKDSKWEITTATGVDLIFKNAVSLNAADGADPEYIASAGSLNTNHEKLLIPGTYENMNITFTVNTFLKQGEEYTNIETKNYDIKAKNSILLEEGNAYCFNIGVGGLTPITFGVASVGAWKPVAADGTTTTPIEVEIN